MSSTRTETPTRISLDKSEAYQQDNVGSDCTEKDKQEFSKSDSSHWFRRTRSSSESDSKNAPTVNLYTHCGRHSNQYLFGPISESLKGLLRKRN
ncbi:hypothetical protein ANO14919_139080 [Xylariales sp. No.14919]|nr:hypothetical protein ANO14919_139080 [Xylariales sp. No.14919]